MSANAPRILGPWTLQPGAGRAEVKDNAVDVVLLVHDRLSITMVLFMFAIGAWGMFSFARGESLGGSISGALAIGQGLISLQILFGVALVVGGREPAETFHYLYGITAIVLIPFAYSYLKARHPRQALFFYSLAALFIGGLGIRGITTGG
jgi:hypothetical protein